MSDPTVDSAVTRSSLLIAVGDPANQQAWAAFIARYSPMIRAWCRRWFPRQEDDMTQVVLLHLVEAVRKLDYDPRKGRFRGWLKTVTDRLMRDLKERQWPPDADGGSQIWDLLAQEPAREDLETVLARQFDLERLEAAREEVQAKVKTQTWTAYVETAERGRKAAEVAAELGMRVGTVHQAKFQVLTLLKRAVASFDDQP